MRANIPDVQLDHMLADAGGMQLVRAPKQFDVIVTDNLFGDMLSDVAAMLTGSLGMLPSASLGAPDPKTGKRKALYEPVHGSAPDIAGKGIANPIAMLASFAMALRYSFGMIARGRPLEQAIAAVLDDGLRTARHHVSDMTEVGTREMGAAILDEFAPLAHQLRPLVLRSTCRRSPSCTIIGSGKTNPRYHMGELVAWALGLGLGFTMRRTIKTSRLRPYGVAVIIVGGLVTLVAGEVWDDLLAILVDVGQVSLATALGAFVLPGFCPGLRWFARTHRRIAATLGFVG